MFYTYLIALNKKIAPEKNNLCPTLASADCASYAWLSKQNAWHDTETCFDVHVRKWNSWVVCGNDPTSIRLQLIIPKVRYSQGGSHTGATTNSRCPQVPPPTKKSCICILNLLISRVWPHKNHAYVFLKYASKYAYLTVFMPLQIVFAPPTPSPDNSDDLFFIYFLLVSLFLFVPPYENPRALQCPLTGKILATPLNLFRRFDSPKIK